MSASARPATAVADPAELVEPWLARWPEALALWSPFLRLRPPVLCCTEEDEVREGLTGSFAMIRLVDQTVVVSLRQVAAELAGFPLEILGHEIGHHVLCPADLSDNGRLLARVRRSLPSIEHHAPMVANLYADVLINDRLQRARGLDLAGVYRALGPPHDRFWTFYLRTYELLWSLPRGTLTGDGLDRGGDGDGGDGHGGDARIEGDAVLGSRLVRTFAGRWLDGAGRWGALCLPYLLDDEAARDEATRDDAARARRRWLDAVHAGAGGFPDGLTELDPGEEVAPVHPSLDPELNGEGDRRGPGGAPLPDRPAPDGPPAEVDGDRSARPGQHREPFEYGQILRDSGLDLTDHEIAVRYYRERAVGSLLPFPTVASPRATDPLPEGVEPWDVGSPLADVDWLETVLRSPVVIPGITTVQRQWGTSTGGEPDRVPLDLDLYIDSSGSMPDPQRTVSHLALAGTIVALSALRAGARVQATLWSGAGQFRSTAGFVAAEQPVLQVICGFIAGGTAFPLHVLRDTYERRRPTDRPAHVLVISDDGVTTMFDRDERGRDGRDVVNHALAAARGGATMVLNLWQPEVQDPALVQAAADGWDIHVVRDWADLVAFARAFSHRRYGEEVGR